MKKWLLLIMLLALGNDIVLDSASADCHDTASICHTCTCIHLVSHVESKTHHVVPTTRHLVLADADLPDFLSDKSIFHPPKTSA